MREHDFTLVLAADPDQEEADRLYGVVDDGTLSTIAGVAQIRFLRQAASLEDAIRSAIASLREVGFDVLRVEIRPQALAQPA